MNTEPPPADRRKAYGSDPSQFGDLRLPKDLNGNATFPVAIVIHGGFWRAAYDLEHIGHLAAALTASGIATWSIEYRRIGYQGGGWPGTFDDAAAAADHLRVLANQYPLDLEHVVTVGHSAGGHLALWLAARKRSPKNTPGYADDPIAIGRAVSLAGVSDLKMAWELGLSNGVVNELMGGSPGEAAERYAAASPADLLPFGVEQVLLHGTEDDIVPVEMSRKYADKCRQTGDKVSLIELAGMGHFEVIDPESDAWPIVKQAVLERALNFH